MDKGGAGVGAETATLEKLVRKYLCKHYCDAQEPGSSQQKKKTLSSGIPVI